MTGRRIPAARRFRPKIWPILTIVVFSVITVWPATPPAEAGGRYYVSNWDETIVVNEDASIEIIENVTFRYLSGDFGFAFRTLVHRGFDELGDVSVTDGDGNRVFHTLNGGSFFQDYEIRWEWPRIYIGADPVERTYVLSYTLTNAANFENGLVDVDRLFWNIVTDYEVYIQDMDIEVILPRSFSSANVTARAYVSGGARPPTPDVLEGDQTIVRYHQSRLEAGGAYTVDVYFPAVVQRPAPRPVVEGPEFSVVLILATIPLLFLVYRRKRRDPPARGDASISELKQNLRPAEAGVLTEGRLQPRHLVATALSLGEQGYLEIQPEFDRSQSLDGVRFEGTDKDTGSLKEYEWSVYRQLHGKTDRYLARGRGVTSTADYDTFVSDGELVKSALVFRGFAERNFFSPHFGIRGDRVFGVLIPLAFLFLAVSLVYYGGLVENLWLFAGGLLSVVPLVLSLRVSGQEKRRTPTGARYKRSIDSYLRNLVSQIETAADRDPFAAAETIKDNASWLALAVDQSWLRRTRRKLEKGMLRTRYEGFELPSYVRIPTELLHIEKTAALMWAFDRTYTGTSTYFSAAAASSPSSGGTGGGGGGGGAGGGGGGGGGGSG